MVGGRARGVLGGRLGVLRRASPRSPTSGCSPPRGCRARDWFAGAELNYAENLLLADTSDARRRAVLHSSELRELDELSWGELRAQVAAAAGGLRALGVGPRRPRRRLHAEHPRDADRVPRDARRSARSGRAPRPSSARASVIDRFAQIEPKVLLAVDGYRHGGKDFDRSAVAAGILAELPSVERAVLLPYLDPGADPAAIGADALGWERAARARSGGRREPPSFEQVPFDHPLWVLYSSGTTGLPKAIVQGHGGILLEQLKKRMHLDLRPGDRMFWFTTTGWMMWNFLVGCLHSEAAIVLYDGSPAHPDLGALWRLADRAGITCMGVSAGLLASCEKAGIEPAREADLTRAARRRLDRLAALAGVASAGSTSRSARTSGCSRPAAAPTSARRSSPAARCCRSTKANCSAARSAARSSPGTRQGNCARRRGRRAGRHRADALDAAVPVGRRRRRAPARQLLRDVPRHLAPRRLDPDHAARRRRDLRPLGLDDQPPGRAHGHQRDLPRGGAVPEVLDALVVDIPGSSDGMPPTPS